MATQTEITTANQNLAAAQAALTLARQGLQAAQVTMPFDQTNVDATQDAVDAAQDAVDAAQAIVDALTAPASVTNPQTGGINRWVIVILAIVIAFLAILVLGIVIQHETHSGERERMLKAQDIRDALVTEVAGSIEKVATGVDKNTTAIENVGTSVTKGFQQLADASTSQTKANVQVIADLSTQLSESITSVVTSIDGNTRATVGAAIRATAPKRPLSQAQKDCLILSIELATAMKKVPKLNLKGVTEGSDEHLARSQKHTADLVQYQNEKAARKRLVTAKAAVSASDPGWVAMIEALTTDQLKVLLEAESVVKPVPVAKPAPEPNPPKKPRGKRKASAVPTVPVPSVSQSKSLPLETICTGYGYASMTSTAVEVVADVPPPTVQIDSDPVLPVVEGVLVPISDSTSVEPPALESEWETVVPEPSTRVVANITPTAKERPVVPAPLTDIPLEDGLLAPSVVNEEPPAVVAAVPPEPVVTPDVTLSQVLEVLPRKVVVPPGSKLSVRGYPLNGKMQRVAYYHKEVISVPGWGRVYEGFYNSRGILKLTIVSTHDAGSIIYTEMELEKEGGVE